MTDRKNLSLDLLLQIAQTLDIPMRGLVAVIELLDDGGTVPFIARYRKESTGNLDEVKVRGIEEKLAYFRDLVARRETILASIAEQGKLTDELKARIEGDLRQERAGRLVPALPAEAPHQGDHGAREGAGTAGDCICGHSSPRPNRSKPSPAVS